MKTLIPNYAGGHTVLIASTARRGKRSLHDKWLTHAAGAFDPDIFLASSGLYYPGIFVLLLDGNYYYYFQPKGTDQLSAFAIIDAVFDYQVFGYPGNWTGEGFNFIFRSTLTVKVIDSGFTNWFNTH
jgi:hypothetical protein